jgi:hypothetical protein
MAVNGNVAAMPLKNGEKTTYLTSPPPAATSPASPESAKTASSPKNAPCPKQGRSQRTSDQDFREVEDLNGWADEVAAGCSKRFSSAVAASAEATRTFSVRGASNRSENKAWERRVLARQGWAGEKGSRFQHPA